MMSLFAVAPALTKNAQATIQALLLQGFGLHQTGKLAQAETIYQQVLKMQPTNFDALHLLGVIATQTDRPSLAIELIRQALKIKPNHAEAYNNLGNAFKEIKQWDAALQNYHQAIALKPNYAEAYYNRGTVLLLQDFKQWDAALQNFNQAIALKPNYAEAYHNRGALMQDLKQWDAALQNYNQTLALKPDYPFLSGLLLHVKMQICHWDGVLHELSALITKVKHHQKAAIPFPTLSIISDPAIQRKVAEIWAQDKFPQRVERTSIPKYPHHNKIRIGYFSADFRRHPAMVLVAEMFALHDRSKFELTAFSFGPNTQDATRKQMEVVFERFIDVHDMSDESIVALARSLEIDIAIDLGGFTQYSRTEIFAMRAAPIQVNYLGYPGSMGVAFMDYLIADATLIPKSSQQYYAEKIAYLPNSYQCRDTRSMLADKKYSRAELGLPETGFVFCCFNNNYKITPHTFDVWMRILNQVEGSVLWLMESVPLAASNLAKEAALRGIAAERLIFAKHMPLEDHLARHQTADLFLDTLPYNAHTTASDALWAGLPVLTCTEKSFASRVAASLLKAIECPELITSSQQEYETLAIEMATHPEKLSKIKQKIATNRLTTALFDTPKFTKHIENAYTQMYTHYHADSPPKHIKVKANLVE